MLRRGVPTVTSQDGTKIAFDKVGSGPAVILVNGAIAYRALDPTLARTPGRTAWPTRLLEAITGFFQDLATRPDMVRSVAGLAA